MSYNNLQAKWKLPEVPVLGSTKVQPCLGLDALWDSKVRIIKKELCFIREDLKKKHFGQSKPNVLEIIHI